MSWIQTFTGRQVFPFNPRAQDIEIRDIAHSLSLQCRFNGHCRVFYSVAEHSIRVSRVVAEEHALWGLLHDAAEAYLKDLPRPIKQCLPEYGELEDRMLWLVAETYELCWPLPRVVEVADEVLLATEARDLMAPPPASWGLRSEPLRETIEPMTALEAEAAFLGRFAELSSRRRRL